MVGALARPAACWVLAGVRIPDALLDPAQAARLPAARPGLRLASVVIDGDRLAGIEAAAPAGLPALDGGSRLLVSPWVDAHTHLDKCYTAWRLPGSCHRLGDAVAASGALRATWTDDDLDRRMRFALGTARARGTRALRSHLDWVQGPAPRAWHVARALREAWRDEIELQLVSICPLALFRDEAAGREVAATLARGGGVLGASVHPLPDQAALLERVFRLAHEHDLDLDFHVDEHLLADTGGLEAIATLTVRQGWQGRVLCGHCCALAVADEVHAQALLVRFAEAGITLVSLPLANLNLQDGQPGRTPRLRGLPPLIEARAAGVPVVIASDNVCDAFVGAADFDPLRVLGIAALAAHLDDPLVQWVDSITTRPARALKLDADGVLRPGAPADLLLLDGRASLEALSRPGGTRLRAGTPVAVAAPAFSELDG